MGGGRSRQGMTLRPSHEHLGGPARPAGNAHTTQFTHTHVIFAPSPPHYLKCCSLPSLVGRVEAEGVSCGNCACTRHEGRFPAALPACLQHSPWRRKCSCATFNPFSMGQT